MSQVAQITSRLAGLSDTSSLDAQVLLAHVLGKPRSWVLAHPEVTLNPLQSQHLEQLIARLESGVPLPYVLGHWEFFGLDFLITPDVLIPRPETELLVEQALAWLRNPQIRVAYSSISRRLPHQRPIWMVDVGAGSGCISISLAVNLPNLHIIATDISMAALHVARRNARKHNVADRIHFIQTDLLSPFSPAPFDLICANLPYIPSEKLRTLNIYGKEPTLALDGGPDGLTRIRQLLHDAPGCLAPGGLLLLEIEASQGEAACSLAQRAFPHAETHLLSDLASHHRLITIRQKTHTSPQPPDPLPSHAHPPLLQNYPARRHRLDRRLQSR